jgi:hypothetical protein
MIRCGGLHRRLDAVKALLSFIGDLQLANTAISVVAWRTTWRPSRSPTRLCANKIMGMARPISVRARLQQWRFYNRRKARKQHGERYLLLDPVQTSGGFFKP